MELDLTPHSPVNTNAALESLTFLGFSLFIYNLSALVPHEATVQAVTYIDRQKVGGGRNRQ